MESILDAFVRDVSNGIHSETVIRITFEGAEHGRVVSGWAIFDPCMRYFRNDRGDWTRDVSQIRLYRTQSMAAMVAKQLAEEDE